MTKVYDLLWETIDSEAWTQVETQVVRTARDSLYDRIYWQIHTPVWGQVSRQLDEDLLND